jgi:hypothetical protein
MNTNDSNDSIFAGLGNLNTTTELLSAEIVAKIQAANPGVEFMAVETPCGVACFKGLTERDWDRYQAAQQEVATQGLSNKMIVRGCLIYPDLQTFDRWLARKPGMTLSLANKISEFSGYTATNNLITKKYGSGG